MLRKIGICGFFIFILGLYLHNITKDIYSGDIGDLVTAACTFGVAHPPGYPLFTIMGGILCHIPLSLPPVTKVALISVFASWFGLIVYYKLAIRLGAKSFIALLSVSILAFSYFYWVHAEIPEVFALNNLFLLTILYLTTAFYQTNHKKYFYILAFVIGLAITHHHTFILIMPGVAIVLVRGVYKNFSMFSKRDYICGILLGVLGLAPYIYVPIAASFNPVINWDNATTLPHFLHLFLRKDYGTAPSIVNEVPITLKIILVKDYFATLASTFSYQIIGVMIIGLFYLLYKKTILGIAYLAAFIISGPFFIYYAAPYITSVPGWGIIERFYTISTTVIAVFIPPGLVAIQIFINRFLSKKIFSFILLGYFIVIPIFMLQFNYPKTDLSRTQIGNTLAKDILINLPKNAVLFVAGDTTSFNIWYVRYVLQVRTDIDIINPPGVAGNVFLDEQVNKYHKKNAKVSTEMIIPNTIADLQKKRPIFATYDITKTLLLPPGTTLLPQGLVYELILVSSFPKQDDYLHSFEKNWKKNHIVRRETLSIENQNLITSEMPTIYSNGLVRVGNFIDSAYKKPVVAEGYYRRALWIDPTNASAYAGLGLVQFKGSNDCTNAITNMNEAIRIYPIYKQYYKQLGILYSRCKVEIKKQEILKKEYEYIFKEKLKSN